jgi:hypothetical protein
VLFYLVAENVKFKHPEQCDTGDPNISLLWTQDVLSSKYCTKIGLISMLWPRIMTLQGCTAQGEDQLYPVLLALSLRYSNPLVSGTYSPVSGTTLPISVIYYGLANERSIYIYIYSTSIYIYYIYSSSIYYIYIVVLYTIKMFFYHKFIASSLIIVLVLSIIYTSNVNKLF